MAVLCMLELYAIELHKARCEEGIGSLGPVHYWCGCTPGKVYALTQDQITQLDSERRAHGTAIRRIAERN
jgi:hypothetical protein